MNLNSSARNKLYFLVFAFCLAAFSTILLPEDSFLFLTQEDGPFETAGALLFLSTAILFFLLYFQEHRFISAVDRAYFSSKTKRTWFLLLALLFIFLMGEEISWGQRIFGWEGVDGNIQNESNFHNSPLFNLHKSKPGAEVDVVKTGIAALLTAKKIFVYIFVSFLFLLPLGVKFVPFIRKLTNRFYIPVPAIELGVLFIVNILIYKAFKPLANFDGAGRGLAEVEEFNFAFILFLIPFIWLKGHKGSFFVQKSPLPN